MRLYDPITADLRTDDPFLIRDGPTRRAGVEEGFRFNV